MADDRNDPTDRYAVIGQPVAHSRSPFIHARFAQDCGQPLRYGLLPAPLEGFAAVARAFFAEGGLGLNVTAPFKLEALSLADGASPAAAQAGAANALRRMPDGRIEAENFDGRGLVADLEGNLGFGLEGRRVLMIGAGGAARGVLGPLLARGPAQILIANRSVARADALVQAFGAHAGASDLRAVSFQTLAKILDDAPPAHLVLHATSAGLHGALPPVSPHALHGAALVYDMQYAVGDTPFLAFARAHGPARLADGIGMLVEQAAEAFRWWRGVRPATAPVIDALRRQMAGEASNDPRSPA